MIMLVFSDTKNALKAGTIYSLKMSKLSLKFCLFSTHLWSCKPCKMSKIGKYSWTHKSDMHVLKSGIWTRRKDISEIHSKGDQKVVQTLNAGIVLNLWLSLVDIRFPYILDKYRKTYITSIFIKDHMRGALDSIHFVRIV